MWVHRRICQPQAHLLGSFLKLCLWQARFCPAFLCSFTARLLTFKWSTQVRVLIVEILVADLLSGILWTCQSLKWVHSGLRRGHRPDTNSLLWHRFGTWWRTSCSSLWAPVKGLVAEMSSELLGGFNGRCMWSTWLNAQSSADTQEWVNTQIFCSFRRDILRNFLLWIN